MKNLVVIVFIFFGCTPEQSTVSEYEIENRLNIPIVLRFYRNGLPSTKTTAITLKGPGESYKKSGETLGSNTTPFDVFDADSISIIFNEERIQGHNLFEPKGFSLLNQQDYQNMGNNKFLYLIGQDNYDASVACEDNCSN